MPCYAYECQKCANAFDVVKAVADLNRTEACSECNSPDTSRVISRTHFYGASDWDKAEYNPAFGKVIRNKKHRDAEAKARGMVEVGNENVEKIHEHFDKQLEKQNKDSWDKV